MHNIISPASLSLTFNCEKIAPEIKNNDDQIEKFQSNSLQIELGIDHEEYSHTTKLTDLTQKSLSEDFN